MTYIDLIFMLPTPDLSHLSNDDKLHVYDPAGELHLQFAVGRG